MTAYKGYATAEGTTRLIQRAGWPAWAYRPVAGLSLTSLGLGTYPGAADSATDRRQIEAITEFLARGGNVIDTAPNYRNGRSEECLGQALGRAIDHGLVSRDEVFIGTKAGLLAENSALAKKFRTGPDNSCYENDCLRESLLESLRRLNLDQVDCLFIHNLELLRLADRSSFLDSYHTIAEALADLMAEGLIRAWGISSWTGFRVPENHPAFLGLTDLLALQGRWPDFLQLPLGIWGSEALTGLWQGGRCILRAAREAGLNVFVNSSLLQGELAVVLNQEAGAVEKAIKFARDADGVDVLLLGLKSPPHIQNWAGIQCQPPSDLSLWLEQLDAE